MLSTISSIVANLNIPQTSTTHRKQPNGGNLKMARSSEDRGLMALIYVGLFAFLLLINYGCGVATPESKAINAAKDAGYTEIEIIDTAYLAVEIRGCGESDNARFTVRGTNPAGEVRTFYVCAGVLKGGTIRSK